MTHDLKSWPGSFQAVASGHRKHEIRKADRNFSVGDSLILREWNPAVFEKAMREHATEGMPESKVKQLKQEAITRAYTGLSLLRKITYISLAGSWGLPADICILSIG